MKTQTYNKTYSYIAIFIQQRPKKSFGLKIQNNVESVRILLPKERVPE